MPDKMITVEILDGTVTCVHPIPPELEIEIRTTSSETPNEVDVSYWSSEE